MQGRGCCWSPDTVTSLFAEDDDVTATVPEDAQALDTSGFTDIQKILLIDILSNDETVVADSMERLDKLCYNDGACDKENCREAKQLGVAVIVGSMMKWRMDRKIQVAGCDVLRHISPGELAIPSKVIDAIGLAMKNFPKDSVLQCRACLTIGNICSAVEANALYAASLLDSVVISAMKRFPKDVRVQYAGSSALYVLSRVEACKALIVAAGGRGALAAALDAHTDETIEDVKKMQKFARDALRILL